MYLSSADQWQKKRVPELISHSVQYFLFYHCGGRGRPITPWALDVHHNWISNYVKTLHKKWRVLLTCNYCMDCLHTCITICTLYQNTQGLKHRILKPIAVSNSCFSLSMNMVTILTILLHHEQDPWTFHTEKWWAAMTFIRLASKSAYTLSFSPDATWLSSGFFLFTNDPTAQSFATTL